VKRLAVLILALTLQMCTREMPKQEKKAQFERVVSQTASTNHPEISKTNNEPQSFFDPDGYYFPEEKNKSCPIEQIHISTLDYYYDGDLHYDKPKFKKPEVEIQLKQPDKSGQFLLECKNAIVGPDKLHLECGAESQITLTVDGAFLDRRGQYWNRSDVKAQETVVLSALIAQTWQGRILYSRDVRFTYWEGD
jgi:hypothetical protein